MTGGLTRRHLLVGAAALAGVPLLELPAAAVPFAPSLAEPPSPPEVWRKVYDAFLGRYSALPSSAPYQPTGNDRGGLLAWGHSETMQSLLLMHEATGSHSYLDRFLEYADGALAARDTERRVPSAPNGRREPVWRSLYGFSQAWLTVKDVHGSDALRVRCRPLGDPLHPTRATVVPAGERFTLVVVRGDGAVDRLPDLSLDPRDLRYAPRYVRRCATISGVTVAELRSRPRPERMRHVVGVVVPPQPYVHPSHTGAIAAPLAAFARVVARTPSLAAGTRYATAAQRYRDAAVAALAVHDREWRTDPATGEGWYVFRRGDPWYLDGTELPLNEFLPLARTYAELAQLPGADPHWAARTRAMTRTFLRALHLDTRRDAYLWSYWLPRGHMYRGWGLDDGVSAHRPSQRPNQVLEDAQHAALDVQVACVLVERGYLTTTVGRRFANTYGRLMASGTGTTAQLAHRVDGSRPLSRNPLAMHYVPAARWRPGIYSHAEAMVFDQLNTLPLLGAHLHGLAWMLRMSPRTGS